MGGGGVGGKVAAALPSAYYGSWEAASFDFEN